MSDLTKEQKIELYGLGEPDGICKKVYRYAKNQWYRYAEVEAYESGVFSVINLVNDKSVLHTRNWNEANLLAKKLQGSYSRM